MPNSSDNDKDSKDLKESQSKTENPFVKFRQLADEHIGSLLQGIIGLPSAFTNNSGNTRFADIDEDLRRRDELQARQKELRNSEARSGREAEDGEAILPAQNLNKHGDTTSQMFANEHERFDGGMVQDLPLYSPVMKSLFAHLNISQDDDEGKKEDWKPLHSDLGSVGHLLNDLNLYKRSSHSDPIKALQNACYHDLNNNLDGLRSQYSLLPYLLFSPYSPIHLSPPGARRSRSRKREQDDFPYFDAFEDLIQVSQGHSLVSPFNYPPWNRYSGREGRPWAPLDYALYISRLKNKGLLQESETRDVEMAWLSRQFPFPKPKKDQKPTSEQVEGQPENGNPQTEAEMYERFLRRASASTTMTASLESLFNETEGWIEKRFAELDLSVPKTRELALPEPEPPMEGKDDHANTMRNLSSDPGRLIFSSTTTEQHKDESGIVWTSVTVQKRFADGRETCTTTSHTEEPARDEVGNLPTASDMDDKLEKKNGGKTEGKGWFWN